MIDRIGPRPTVLAGGVLIGAAWVLNGIAGTLAAALCRRGASAASAPASSTARPSATR